MSITFRTAVMEDADAIASFQIAMAWETEKLKLDEEICKLGVRAVFKDNNLGQYHVVAEGTRVIGSLLITYEWSDWRNGRVWWIQSVYLEPNHRGQGLFSDFYKYIQSKVLQDSTVRGLRLYVDRTNGHAQKVYEKIGMNGNHYALFEWMKTF